MSRDLDVVVTGFDVDQRQAETGMIRLFGLDPLRAKRFVEQLPVIAKRCPDARTAERYAEALRAIGARVDVRPHAAAFRDSLPPVATTSLPAPPPELAARLRESLRVSRAADSAIARFREGEGLEPLGDLGFDPYNPEIPKAPAIPHDLARMPNAALPRKSDRPEWMIADPLSLTPGKSGDAPDALQPHTDAQLPPRGRPSLDSGMRPRARTPEQVNAVGVAHAARASIRPGLSARPSAAPQPVVPLSTKLARRWPIVAGLLLVAAAGAWRSGAFESDADARRAAWRREGISAGEHAEIRAFMARPGNSVHGIDGAKLRDLLDKLERAGVPVVYAINVTESGPVRRAGALLVEMPRDPAARQTVRFHAAQAQGLGSRPTQERGEHHLVIELK